MSVPRACREAVESASYKPGWRLDLVEDVVYGGAMLRISAKVPDTYRPDVSAEVVHASTVPPIGEDDPMFWRRWLLHCLQRAEDHETREWLTFGGERTFDPHADP